MSPITTCTCNSFRILVAMTAGQTSHLELVQFLSDLDEAQMKLPTEMVSQAAVVVMEAEVGGAHLAHPQLLLLEAGSRHGVSVLLLKREKCI